MKRTTKWRSLGERVAKLKDGEKIVLEPEGDLTEEARKIYHGLNGIRACDLVLRTVKVVGAKIVITRVATWRPPVLRHDDLKRGRRSGPAIVG